MAQLNSNVILAPGRTKLNTAGPITTTGTLVFTVPVSPNGNISAIFQVVGTATGLASALQVDCSATPGSNFANYVTSFLAAATTVVSLSSASANPLVGGATFAINITAQPTSSDFYVIMD